MGWILPALLVSGIVAPPIIQWLGDQTWNKQALNDQHTIAEAAKFDTSQREQAAKVGINPYIPSSGAQPAATANNGDPFSAMMPMMMMMMMMPMMTNMMSGGDDE